MIKVETKGSFKNTFRYLNKIMDVTKLKWLDKYGEEGVRALESATPVDTGKTASCWYYVINRTEDGNILLTWKNANLNDGVNVALLIQYGHATWNGGYVRGIDYINPALRPIFEDILKRMEAEVTMA